MNDLYKEHEQHYSDEWVELKDKCSECYKMCQKYGRKIDIPKSNHNWIIEDLKLNPNPLE